MEFIQIEVQQREARGTSNARRMRRDGFVPAVLYGLDRRNLPLSISLGAVEGFLRTGSHLVELKLDGATRPAIIREVQLDPISDAILHIDFHRVDKDVDIEDDVALFFKGQAPGIKEGGVFASLEDTIRIRCRPYLIPREIVVDVSLLGLGDVISADELKLPEGVALVTPGDTPVCNCALPRVAVETDTDEGGEEAAAPLTGEAAPSD